MIGLDAGSEASECVEEDAAVFGALQLPLLASAADVFSWSGTRVMLHMMANFLDHTVMDQSRNTLHRVRLSLASSVMDLELTSSLKGPEHAGQNV